MIHPGKINLEAFEDKFPFSIGLFLGSMLVLEGVSSKRMYGAF